MTGRWWAKHLLVLTVLIMLINLGLWQLRRLEQRRELNNHILAVLDQDPIPVTGEAVDPEKLHFRRVSVKGTFDHAATLVLRNRSLNDRPGLHLITPLRISGSEQAVLVDRGWIPRGQADPTPQSLIGYDVSGEVSLEGIAYRTQTRPSSLSPLDPPLKAGQTRLVAWFRVDIDRIQEQVPYPLLPIFVEQLPDAKTKPDSLPQPAGSVELTEGPHLGYALQWFSFAAILVVTYTLFIRQELKQ